MGVLRSSAVGILIVIVAGILLPLPWQRGCLGEQGAAGIVHIASPRSSPRENMQLSEEQESQGMQGIGVDVKLEKVSLDVGEKTILHDVSFQIQSCHAVAVMGSSGCGKSSLMKVMSGRAGHGTVKGKITYNGHPLPPELLRQKNRVRASRRCYAHKIVRQRQHNLPGMVALAFEEHWRCSRYTFHMLWHG